VAKTTKEKTYQRVLMQFTYPQNQHLVFEALKAANRLDLVGFGKHCLIKPMKSPIPTRPHSNYPKGKSPQR